MLQKIILGLISTIITPIWLWAGLMGLQTAFFILGLFRVIDWSNVVILWPTWMLLAGFVGIWLFFIMQ